MTKRELQGRNVTCMRPWSMVKRVDQSDALPDGREVQWPRPVYDGVWVDHEGTTWRMRGAALEAKAARRLARRPGVRVVHAYGTEVAEVEGARREELLGEVESFLRGEAPQFSVFEMGDFRDADHRVMLLVQESC